MNKGKQFQSPLLGMTSSYQSPKFTKNGLMTSGHMLVVHDSKGLPRGFVEWGHKTTPNGKAVIIGNDNDTQPEVDALFGHLWNEAGAHAKRTSTEHQLSRENGISQYVAPHFYTADGKFI